MPLIKIVKKKQEEEYIFTEYEKVLLARKMFPEEQIKSVNHNERLLDAMLEDEIRDASPEHTEADIFSALLARDKGFLLKAIKNLTVQEKREIAERIYRSILISKKEDYLIKTKDGKMIVNSEKFKENAKRLILLEEPLDLFDLCVRLGQK